MNTEEFEQFEKSQRWIFAKSYASWCPHWYIVTDKMEPEDLPAFREFVQFIEDNGVMMKWNKYTRKYYDQGEYRYWHMVSSEEVDTVFLINRELISGSKCKPL